MDRRPGYKQSLLLKAGIKITPVGIGDPVTTCTKFRVKVTRLNKQGVEIEREGKNPYQTYPLKGPGNIWSKIEEITDYYYKKLKK